MKDELIYDTANNVLESFNNLEESLKCINYCLDMIVNDAMYNIDNEEDQKAYNNLLEAQKLIAETIKKEG